jgi:lipopolysaccharide/colanic/teichoic acid biosynthesis glycosyltransferase
MRSLSVGSAVGVGGRSRGWYTWGKLVLDCFLASIGLVLAAPFLLAIAVAIRLDSPGPALFQQVRVGRNGREFTMYKFRTMATHADDAPHRAAFERFYRASSGEPVAGGTFKLQRDPRVTRVGRVLRTTSLDELPQLLNVLNGTMSLVGPRPPIPYETELYEDRHWRRMVAQPGITGLWQATARSQVSFEEMVVLDLDYIARQSLVLDLKILALTVGVVLRREGAG